MSRNFLVVLVLLLAITTQLYAQGFIEISQSSSSRGTGQTSSFQQTIGQTSGFQQTIGQISSSQQGINQISSIQQGINQIATVNNALALLTAPVQLIAQNALLVMESLIPTLDTEAQQMLNAGVTVLKSTLDNMQTATDAADSQNFDQIFSDAATNLTQCFLNQINDANIVIQNSINTIQDVTEILDAIPQSVNNCSNSTGGEQIQCLGLLIGNTLLDVISLGSTVQQTVANTTQLLTTLGIGLNKCVTQTIDNAAFIASAFVKNNISGL